MKFRNLLRCTLLAGIFLCTALSAFSQSNYLQLSAGYNFNFASLIDDTEMSYGKGVTPGITIGRMFTDKIGAELSVRYLLGSKDQYSYTYQIPSGYGPITMNAEVTKYSRMLLLEPAFVVSGNSPSTNIYAKFGPVIGFGKIYEKYYEDGDGSPLERNLELKGGAALGGQTTFGVNFNAEAKTSLFAEANLKLLWYSPTHGEVVKLLSNGKDRTADMSVRGREVEYVKSPNNSYGNYDTPAQAPKFNHPFSSAGFNIGLKRTF
ncbi:hypothetical protein [Adhaeribacter terreus]|uniref:Outer membrane protein beta-barrel domain-containing protein n=1 Tax=Adhaeribacter terreus TaxID=529703 RepID=A0ABW0ECJ9_9BACT